MCIEFDESQSNQSDEQLEINEKQLICTEYYASESLGSSTESQSKQYTSVDEDASPCSSSPRNIEEVQILQIDEQVNQDISPAKIETLTILKGSDNGRMSTNCPNCRKDSFDLFFEYISMSVKSLPPKLATELKNQISQLIAEFELRAIREAELNELKKQVEGEWQRPSFV